MKAAIHPAKNTKNTKASKTAIKQLIYGRHPIAEFLKTDPKPQDLEEIFVSPHLPAQLRQKIKSQLANVPLRLLSSKEWAKLFPHIHHQGVLFRLCASESGHSLGARASWQDYVSKAGGPLLLLDSIQDAQNLGSIIRSAESLGVKALFITGKGASLNDAVHRVSAGASFHLPIFPLANLYSLTKALKKMNFWICASAQSQQKEKIYTQELSQKKGPLCLEHTQTQKLPPTKELALIIGHEGHGVKSLLLEQSDFILSVPLTGKISSLNAGVAAGILIDRLIHRAG